MDYLINTRTHYLPVTEKDKAWGNYVVGAGCFSVEPGAGYNNTPCQKYSFHCQEGRILQDYALVYVTRGDGIFRSETCGELNVETGDVIALFPGEWHTYHPSMQNGWDEYWVIFNGETPNHMQRNGILSPQKALLKPGLDSELHQQMVHILGLIESRRIGYEQLAASETTRLIAAILALDRMKPGKESHFEQKIHEARCLLEEHHQTEVDMETIAEKLNISYSYFRKLFRDMVGLTPHQYLLQVRISKAKEMLESQNLSVKEISAAVGFLDELYFSRLFKKKTGVAPSRWGRIERA
jgi:AraC-like DNA-binding protein